ncbi:EAL domain-containing response regulator [Mastigocoleus testarum]|uniref:Diguanylate cyclase n=1 Tax=Mastigocoleus testarum BC008 TaxID=371196 RepID=A0A0V7ZWJ4_9CYAN|nr:EAL domain-containing response regulator [Mastigocoleus testarum]KST68936.1 diguanylate cyclase [Mastigocoleus testarum BC008]KST69005.1 diguanylate cyclase [Mastigocoleus testarum BC008]
MSTKVLLIEDEISVRENISDLLEAEGFETITAANGKVGIDLAISQIPDIILCDLMMPEVDGYGVLERLRQEILTATIPFIFLTAKSTRTDVRKGMDLGADDYLTKPFTRAELLSAISSRLDKQIKMKNYLSNNYSDISNFSPEILLIKSSLRRAIEAGQRHEFQTYYQPIVDIISGKIIAAESLVRWISPELGMVSPAELIPLAESTGLIIPIGEWILENVCKQAKIWDEANFSSLLFSVNVSNSQFTQANFSDKISRILAEFDIPANCLELEITENTIMSDFHAAVYTMGKLQSLGVKIAIDDFGTGNSSLVYLKDFPIDTLKIDRYFIHNIANEPEKSAITKGLIQIAHNLDIKVIAKGVETEAELNFLRQNKCDAIQGFLFSPAIAATEFEDLLINPKYLPT